MKVRHFSYALVAVLALVQACAYNEMTYFRKHGASLNDERRDWGLCGGNFHADGHLSPIVRKEVVDCMGGKGYQTLNDYYEEQFISFQKTKSDNKGPTLREMEACGFQMYKASQTCKGHWFVLAGQLDRVSQCMKSFGFEPTIPRLGNTFRVVEDPNKLPPAFCTFLSPKNRRGGLSFGGSRLE